MKRDETSYLVTTIRIVRITKIFSNNNDKQGLSYNLMAMFFCNNNVLMLYTTVQYYHNCNNEQ